MTLSLLFSANRWRWGTKRPPRPAAGQVLQTATFDVIGDTEGKVRVLNFVPSLNTGICSAQTRRFN